MSLIDLDDFKAVLGVGDIYPDETLNGVIEAAENILKGYLAFHRTYIVDYKIENNVATYYTQRDHDFVVGQTLTVTKCPSTITGNKVITNVTRNTFQAAVSNADVTRRAIYPVGEAYEYQTETIYDDVAEVREAALMIAVDLFNARQTAQGIGQDATMNPGPYRMGRSLITRVTGLISAHRDVWGRIR